MIVDGIIKQLLINIKEMGNKEGFYMISKSNSFKDGEGVAVSPFYPHTYLMNMKQSCFILSNWKIDMNEHFPLLSSIKHIDYQKKEGI